MATTVDNAGAAPATQSKVQGPVASTSPGSRISGPVSDLLNQDLPFNQIPGLFRMHLAIWEAK